MQAEELRTLALEIQWHKTEKQNIELKQRRALSHTPV